MVQWCKTLPLADRNRQRTAHSDRCAVDVGKGMANLKELMEFTLKISLHRLHATGSAHLVY